MRDGVKKNAVMCDGAGKGRNGGRFCAAKSLSRAYFSSIPARMADAFQSGGFCLILLKKSEKGIHCPWRFALLLTEINWKTQSNFSFEIECINEIQIKSCLIESWCKM